MDNRHGQVIKVDGKFSVMIDEAQTGHDFDQEAFVKEAIGKHSQKCAYAGCEEEGFKRSESATEAPLCEKHDKELMELVEWGNTADITRFMFRCL